MWVNLPLNIRNVNQGLSARYQQKASKSTELPIRDVFFVYNFIMTICMRHTQYTYDCDDAHGDADDGTIGARSSLRELPPWWTNHAIATNPTQLNDAWCAKQMGPNHPQSSLLLYDWCSHEVMSGWWSHDWYGMNERNVYMENGDSKSKWPSWTSRNNPLFDNQIRWRTMLLLYFYCVKRTSVNLNS